MKKIATLLISVALSGASFVFAQNSAQKAEQKPVAATGMFSQPLMIAWFYAAETTHLNPIADSDRAFLPMADGSISAVSLSTGELLWKSATGADLTASPIECNSELVVAAKKGAGTGESNAGVLRILDKRTGLTLRSFDVARPLTTLASNGGIIYAGSEDAKVYAIKSGDGAKVWTFQTGGPIHSQAVYADGRVYIGSDDASLYAIDAANGNQIWKALTKGKVTGQPASDGKRIYFGSNDGWVYAAHIGNGAIAWKLRTGATVDAPPIKVKNHILVGSYDDFLYALNPDSGDIVWKQRVTNRVGSRPIIENENALIGPLRARKLSVFDSNQGLLLNETTLPDDMGEIVSAPFQIGKQIIVSTDLGLVALKAK